MEGFVTKAEFEAHKRQRLNKAHGGLSAISSSSINVATLDDPSIHTIQDFIDYGKSAGYFEGGEFTDNGDGTIDIAAGKGMIRASDDDTGELLMFEWDAKSNLTLTDNSENYIYIDYNSGSPDVVASTSLPSDHNSKILLGMVYRKGTDLYMIRGGQVINNYETLTLFKDLEVNGKLQRVSGLMISEKANRKFAISEGVIYAGIQKKTISAFDTSGSDTFTMVIGNSTAGFTYYTGQTQIDNTHYDDNGTLAELDDPQGWRTYYGVHWIYQLMTGEVYDVLGKDSYLLSEAENAQPPTDIPDVIQKIGRLIGKIIIEKNASSFEEISSAFIEDFTPAVVRDHNLMSGLQGGESPDEYYHLDEDDYNTLTGGADASSLHNHDSSYVKLTDYEDQDILDKIKNVDGSGSGLDADKLDGVQASQFLRSDTNDTKSGHLTFTSGSWIYFEDGKHLISNNDGKGNFNIRIGHDETETVKEDGYPSQLEWSQSSGWLQINLTSTSKSTGDSITWDRTWEFNKDGGLYYSTNGGSTKYKFWHEGNDGSGSGLDADKLDGQEGSYYRNADNLNAGTVSRARLGALWRDTNSNLYTYPYIQTGSKSVANNGTITYDYAFTNTPRVVISPHGFGKYNANPDSITTTSFIVRTKDTATGGFPTLTIDWIAIGQKT